jgi:hypothetical protein
MTTSSWFNASFVPNTQSGFTDFQVTIQPQSFQRDLNLVRCGESVANDILNQVNGDIYVGVSGGNHSEFVLRRFASVNANRTVPIIVSLPWNSEEVAYARSLCTKLNLDPWVVEYTDRAWLYNKLNSLSYQLGRAGYMQSVVSLVGESVEGQGGKLVTGGGHHFNIGQEPNGRVTCFIDEFYFHEWDYYVVENGHPGPFFTKSQQLFDSMLMNTDMTLDVYSSLCYMYRHLYRPCCDIDTELFQQARTRWSWGSQRPRWRSKFNRSQLKTLFNSLVI